MIGALVDNSKGWLHWIAFIKKWNDLHDIRVANPDSCRVSQRDYMLVSFWLSHQGNNFQDVVVKHEYDEGARLTEENWIRRLFLIMQNLLTDIASADNFNLVLALVIADEGNCEVCENDEEVVWSTLCKV